MAINSTINASIKKSPFDVLYGEYTLLSRESSIKPYTHPFARKMIQLVTKVKSAMYDA